MAFLEDQLGEQASACWKQRKWSIVADDDDDEDDNNNNSRRIAKAIAKEKRHRANSNLAHSVGITWAHPSGGGGTIRSHCTKNRSELSWSNLGGPVTVLVRGMMIYTLHTSSASSLFYIPVKTELKL
jgi:hypothetical protein